MASYIACTDCENDKIRLRSHSSLSWFCTSHVQTVSVEGSDLNDEENVTDVKKRETNKERQTRLVNLCHCLHISVMAPHVD